jgi:hypothetical protein
MKPTTVSPSSTTRGHEVGIDVRVGDRIRRWSDELLLAGAQREVVRRDDRLGGQFFKSEFGHGDRLTRRPRRVESISMSRYFGIPV